jgi:hypothetical protein
MHDTRLRTATKYVKPTGCYGRSTLGILVLASDASQPLFFIALCDTHTRLPTGQHGDQMPLDRKLYSKPTR